MFHETRLVEDRKIKPGRPRQRHTDQRPIRNIEITWEDFGEIADNRPLYRTVSVSVLLRVEGLVSTVRSRVPRSVWPLAKDVLYATRQQWRIQEF